MELSRAAAEWRAQGFTILPGYLADVVGAGVAELGVMFPSAEGFHGGGDPRRERFVGDEFAGIDSFPFASAELSLLAVHERLIGLASALLESDDLRIYSAEVWAKYTGANDYDQELHRDYLNHTILVPSKEYRQVEMFVYLVDVPEDLGPPHLVPSLGLDAVPNWFPRQGSAERTRFDAGGRPDLYELEVSAAGPAGTVVAFELGTLHRGTGLTQPGGVRYSMHLNYRRAADEWAQRQAWADLSHQAPWFDFVSRATPRQLELFGFPPPGHPFWTPETLAGMALRYPGLDLAPWRHGVSKV